MDSKFNILIPALGVIAALLWRLIYSSENQNTATGNENRTSKQDSTISGEMCAECGSDRIPANKRKCGQCGSLKFTVSPHVKICGYCRAPNGIYRDTCISCNDTI